MARWWQWLRQGNWRVLPWAMGAVVFWRRTFPERPLAVNVAMLTVLALYSLLVFRATGSYEAGDELLAKDGD